MEPTTIHVVMNLWKAREKFLSLFIFPRRHGQFCPRGMTNSINHSTPKAAPAWPAALARMKVISVDRAVDRVALKFVP